MPEWRRKVECREDAEALLAELRSTGESLVDLCRRRGVDGRSLRCWRTNLARGERGALGGELRLMEVGLPAASSRYRLHVGDIVVEVDDDFHAGTLSRLLALVRSC